MLDYAANAVVYWPVEQIISRFEARCAVSGVDPETELQLLDVGENELQDYWSKVKTNLQAGKIRLVFVADTIPPELRRIIEFLNTQMDPAEVLGLELKQYTGEGLQTLVPRVVGRTAEADRKKAAEPRERRAWDETSFFSAIMDRHGEAVTEVARQIWTWANAHGRVNYGRGVHNGSYIFGVEHIDNLRWIFAVFASGGVEIYFQHMRNYPPFGRTEKRLELLERLNAIEGVLLPKDSIERRPSILLEIFVPPDRLQDLFGVLSWTADEIKRAGAGLG